MCSPHSRPGSGLSSLPSVLHLLNTSPTHSSKHSIDTSFRIRHFAGTVRMYYFLILRDSFCESSL
jgi:hypothetical protein